jgi:predicted metalloprotease
MRWSTGRRSGNVVDRRMSGGGRMIAGGGVGAIVLAIVMMLAGVDPSAILGTGGGSTAPPTAEENRLADFASVVLADTEDVWREQFKKMGRTYREPKLVLFRGQVSSACGHASAAVGPFYCPADQTIYLDLGFFAELHRRFGAPGDFAQAYVIAHEVGHHVQHLLGTTGRVGGPASAIGDDTLQKRSQGRVVPDSFTHGSSAQRVAWFRRGFESGDLSRGDTFDDRVFQEVSAR